jgi:hypothetical protein
MVTLKIHYKLAQNQGEIITHAVATKKKAKLECVTFPSSKFMTNVNDLSPVTINGDGEKNSNSMKTGRERRAKRSKPSFEEKKKKRKLNLHESNFKV